MALTGIITKHIQLLLPEVINSLQPLPSVGFVEHAQNIMQDARLRATSVRKGFDGARNRDNKESPNHISENLVPADFIDPSQVYKQP